jgi:excisionase family DNA binding protein
MPTMTEPELQLLTVADVADRLRISTRQVWRLIADDELETVRIGSRAVRVPASSVKAYLARQVEREKDRW